MKKLIAAALLAAFGVWTSVAQASTATSDITDMWWIPSESGWGVNIIEQNDVAFATFFVFDAQKIPMWYTSALFYQGIGSNGSLVWSGDLIAATGPWFGGPFPPSSVTRRKAGSVTFTLVDLNDAILQYSVDGVVVTKAVQRYAWTLENYTGSYLGGYSVRFSNCNPSSLNGVVDFGGAMSVTQNGSAVMMSVATDTGDACTFNGTYSQAGKYGQVDGTYACGDGTSGTFSAYEMTPTINGFMASVSGKSQFCQWSGSLGGITLAP